MMPGGIYTEAVVLYRGVITGSIARETYATRLFWNLLPFIVERNSGEFEGTTEWIAGTLRMEEEDVRMALEVLQRPDPHSNSKEEGGRRIIKIGEYRYRVVNHGKYLERAQADARRAREARRKQEQRDAQAKEAAKAAKKEASEAQAEPFSPETGEAPPKKSHHKKKPEGEAVADKYAKGEVPRQQCPLNDEQMALLMGVKQTLQPGSKPGTAEYDAWLRLVELHPIDRIQTVSRFISNDVQPPADNGWTGWKAVCKSVTSMEKNWDMIYAAMIAEDPEAEGPEGAERKLREQAKLYAELMPEDYPTAEDAYRELKADRERDFAMGKI